MNSLSHERPHLSPGLTYLYIIIFISPTSVELDFCITYFFLYIHFLGFFFVPFLYFSMFTFIFCVFISFLLPICFFCLFVSSSYLFFLPQFSIIFTTLLYFTSVLSLTLLRVSSACTGPFCILDLL
jgi:hypothetical protein